MKKVLSPHRGEGRGEGKDENQRED